MLRYKSGRGLHQCGIMLVTSSELDSAECGNDEFDSAEYRVASIML